MIIDNPLILSSRYYRLHYPLDYFPIIARDNPILLSSDFLPENPGRLYQFISKGVIGFFFKIQGVKVFIYNMIMFKFRIVYRAFQFWFLTACQIYPNYTVRVLVSSSDNQNYSQDAVVIFDLNPYCYSIFNLGI